MFVTNGHNSKGKGQKVSQIIINQVKKYLKYTKGIEFKFTEFMNSFCPKMEFSIEFHENVQLTGHFENSLCMLFIEEAGQNKGAKLVSKRIFG